MDMRKMTLDSNGQRFYVDEDAQAQWVRWRNGMLICTVMITARGVVVDVNDQICGAADANVAMVIAMSILARAHERWMRGDT